MKLFKICIIVFIGIHTLSAQGFKEAASNGKLANEGFNKCLNFTNAWLKYADPYSKLIPRNLQESKNYWNANDAAADNYPFMVLTSAILDTHLLNTTMIEMLENEARLTSRVNKLPDTYSFTKRAYLSDTVNMSQVIFGSAEYMKDGLLPLTEWMGTSPWLYRMLDILDDLRLQVQVVKEIKGNYLGNSAVVEVNGDLLQVLCRMYWLTQNKDYLNWAIKIGDHYLLGDNLPTRKLEYLRLRDHGCEIIAGLSELYVTVHFADPEKKKLYERPMHEMLDKILEVGRNPDGFFYDGINPRTGKVVDQTLADTWGYTLNAYYSVYLVDKNEPYKQAVLKTLQNLGKYKNYLWEGQSSDGYADAIECALNLYNREPNPVAKDWIESEIKVLWSKQKESGIIEGWHGDGNFARTTIMYCLWKTQGATVKPWRNDVVYGAVKNGNGVKLSLSAGNAWNGLLIFDKQRHKEVLHIPIDYPRINQFQEWFTALPGKKYKVKGIPGSPEKTYTGEELQNGILIELKPGKDLELEITPI